MSIKLSIKDFMTTDIISVNQDMQTYDAVKKMVEHDIGSIVVKKNNEFIGIVTERDILNKICSEKINIMDLSVGKVMSSPLITIDSHESIGKAAMIMESKNIRRLLVKKDGKIVGLITQKDILRETLNAFLAIQAIS